MACRHSSSILSYCIIFVAFSSLLYFCLFLLLPFELFENLKLRYFFILASCQCPVFWLLLQRQMLTFPTWFTSWDSLWVLPLPNPWIYLLVLLLEFSNRARCILLHFFIVISKIEIVCDSVISVFILSLTFGDRVHVAWTFI